LAEKDSEPKSTWPVPILLLVTLAGGYLFSQSPLKSFRPFHESLDTSSIHIDQQVSARLWQDPLEAVINYKAKHNPSRLSADEIKTHIKGLIRDRASDVAVLISTLDDSPYSEGRETRIRVRYVVGAALNHACYVPENAEGIGLMSWPTKKFDKKPPVDLPQAISETSVKVSDKALVLEVPFEWYRKRKVVTCSHEYPDRLLVLWVKGSDIEGAPLQYLNHLVASVVPEYSSKENSSVSIKLLGPWGSEALRVMMKSAMTPGISLGWSQRHVELLSPWATADPLLLLAAEDESVLTSEPPLLTESRKRMASAFKDARIDWAYTIGSDRHVLAQLGEELQRRQVHIDKAKIAVVSEWDTFYGRMLPLEFRAMALCKHRSNTFCFLDDEWRQALASSRNADDWQNRAWKRNAGKDAAADSTTLNKDGLKIDRYTYLRGLDGEMAHEQRQTQSKARKSQQDSIYEFWKDEQSISSLERPDGPSQYDYVRRLSAQLKEAQTVDDPYVAIGVLGSDPHDKLLILQALKDEFPGAIFFTTDLDARFLHPSQQGWARNLIIASPFGLRLDDTHQRDVPPFRDSYQTAAYHALITSLAMTNPQSRQQPQQDASARSIPHGCLNSDCVRLFEVGRTQFINLSTDFPEPHPNEEAQRLPADRWQNWSNAVLAFAVGCLLMYLVAKDLTVFVLGGGLSLLLGLALCWHLAGRPGEEPFFWTEGVSIWPTELVRLLAGMLAIVFILTTFKLVTNRKARIASTYLPYSTGDQSPFDFSTIWNKHDRQTTLGAISFKVVLGVVLGFLLALPIFFSFPPPSPPARGAISPRFDQGVLVFSVLSLYMLLALVVSLSISCKELLNDLREHRLGFATTWGHRHSRRLPREVINNWFTIRVSAEYTTIFKTVTPYPLYVLFLLIVSRNGYFDHWTFPVSLVIVYIIMFSFSTLCSVKLWSSASKLRKEVLENLEEESRTAYLEGDTILAANIENIMLEVKALKKGVYGSWTDQPIWNTMLYPLGGVAILSFLDFMAGR
jgi:hypothetical protein